MSPHLCKEEKRKEIIRPQKGRAYLIMLDFPTCPNKVIGDLTKTV